MASSAGRPRSTGSSRGKPSGREQNAGLQNLLRLGLYQIFWLDRIPDHAAVHETVELAKHSGFGPQAGFVNAILRGYLREHEADPEAAGRIEEIPACHRVARIPNGWWKNGAPVLATIKTAQLLEWNNTPPKTFARVNALKAGSARCADRTPHAASPPKWKMPAICSPAGARKMWNMISSGATGWRKIWSSS